MDVSNLAFGLLGFESTTFKSNTKFLLPSILLQQQLCFDDEHPLQNLLLSNWVRIVVWTWRWHLFSWWPSHHVWILVWIIGSFYLISQPYILFCCSTLLLYPILYCPHFFQLLLSHSISNRIANMHCAMHSMAKYFYKIDWLSDSDKESWLKLRQLSLLFDFLPAWPLSENEIFFSLLSAILS